MPEITHPRQGCPARIERHPQINVRKWRLPELRSDSKKITKVDTQQSGEHLSDRTQTNINIGDRGKLLAVVMQSGDKFKAAAALGKIPRQWPLGIYFWRGEFQQIVSGQHDTP